ncbi:hypothetical protein BDZ89DRAFT_1062740 [Hymenopellis radicata]|nr:hypothetical protein BDZ89DRAFT_1062740 [Hymenopellis radicata]
MQKQPRSASEIRKRPLRESAWGHPGLNWGPPEHIGYAYISLLQSVALPAELCPRYSTLSCMLKSL